MIIYYAVVRFLSKTFLRNKQQLIIRSPVDTVLFVFFGYIWPSRLPPRVLRRKSPRGDGEDRQWFCSLMKFVFVAVSFSLFLPPARARMKTWRPVIGKHFLLWHCLLILRLSGTKRNEPDPGQLRQSVVVWHYIIPLFIREKEPRLWLGLAWTRDSPKAMAQADLFPREWQLSTTAMWSVMHNNKCSPPTSVMESNFSAMEKNWSF